MRGIASLLLMGIASSALAASPPTFDRFQSSVENKVAPPEGTFFNTGKFKSLCSCMQNRRDHPGGQGTFDFPGVSLLEYAGNGRWKREEDFWAWGQREVAMRGWQEACAKVDPDHAAKKTRWNWGNGPEWTRGGRSWAERPSRR